MIRLLLAAICILIAGNVFARNSGQWATDDEISHWIGRLMQPDRPPEWPMSCCGEADMYYADSFRSSPDGYIAIITDERDDLPLRRPHVDVGTEVKVPNAKIKWDEGNPTGHALIFLGFEDGHPTKVFCYVPGGGG